MRTTLAIIALCAPFGAFLMPETGMQDDGSYRVVDAASYGQMCETMTSTELDEYICKRDNPYT